MMTGKFVRKFLIAGVAVESTEKMVTTKCDQVCRASELPLYIHEENKRGGDLCPAKPSIIERVFGSVRKQVWGAKDSYSNFRKQGEDFVSNGTQKASSMVKYLAEEADEKTKMGAVGVGALTGFILGMRGGVFKRLIYASTGAVAMCAVCYPQQTAEYSQEGIRQARMLARIAYNFIYGVSGTKKEGEDAMLALPQMPKMPGSMIEMWGMATDLGKSATSMITGKLSFEDEEHKPVEVLHATPEDVIQESHNIATQSCHCPIGACLGRHDSEEK